MEYYYWQYILLIIMILTFVVDTASNYSSVPNITITFQTHGNLKISQSGTGGDYDYKFTNSSNQTVV
ncbi:MAG: hypothetical protein Ta2E_01510 [Mycoplasmoidaceae bacterium]|nr:MAG: hypothetical protein Ta2E_01510 [Mycoplasmoidaceae bacterium]